MNYLDSFNPETAAEALRILAKTGEQPALAVVMCRGVPPWSRALTDKVERFLAKKAEGKATPDDLDSIETMATEAPHGWAKILAQIALTGDPEGSLLVALYERVFMAAVDAGARPRDGVDFVRNLASIVLGDRSSKRMTAADVEEQIVFARAVAKERERIAAEKAGLEESKRALEQEKADLEAAKAAQEKAADDIEAAKSDAEKSAPAEDSKPAKGAASKGKKGGKASASA